MLKIDPNSNTLLALGSRTLEPASLFERHSVTDLIANSPEVFFADLGRALFLLARDAPLGGKTARRADLLLIDPEGRLYVGRLQHGKASIDLVEALEDAGRVASWGPRQVLSLLDDRRRELLRTFLQAPIERINAEQGLLLLAEEFDLDTLSAAGWLKARYGVRIDCYQLRLASDSTTQIDYLDCQDLSDQVDEVYRSRKGGQPDGAPWPATIVPDISDSPAPNTAAPEEPAPAETAPQAQPAEATPTSEPAPPVELETEPVAADPDVEAAEPEPAPEPEPATDPQPLPAGDLPASPLEAEVAAALSDAQRPEEQPQAEPPPGIEDMIIPADLPPEDDPLAAVIAGLDAPEQLEAEAPETSDRRSYERSRDYQARRLRLDYFGRLLGARLVDFSNVGLGVEALSPLPVGAEVGISGEIASDAGTLGIEGRAKVEHCRSTEDGVCRIGFSLAKAKINELDDPETFDRR